MNRVELEKIKQKALEDKVPIIMDDTLEVVAKILTENGNDIDFNEKNIFFVKISFDVLEQIIHTEGVTLNDRQNEEALSVLEMYEFGKNLIENNKIKKENIFYYAYIVSPSRSDSRFSVCGIELNNLIDESYKIFSEFGNYFDISFSNDVVTIMFD